jgi:hypothetical protein
MPNQQQVDLIVNAISKGFDQITKDLNQLGESGKKAAPPKDAGLKWTELASKVSVAKQAYQTVAAAAGEAYDFVKQGAELELARSQFDNLATSIGTTSDALLDDLGVATSGMMSNAEMISSASQLISLGLADNQEQTVRLAKSVSTLGLDMQQVILTFANNSKARLDALGLSVEGVTQKAAELEAQGFSGDAFDEAVLIGLEEKMKLLGDASETTAGQLKRIEAEWENVVDGYKQGAAQMSAPTISFVSASISLKNAIDDGALSLSEYVKMQARLTYGSLDAAGALEELAVAYRTTAKAEKELSGAISETEQEMVARTEEAVRGAAGMEAYRTGVEKGLTTEQAYAVAVENSKKEQEASAAALEEQNRLIDESIARKEENARITKELAAAGGDYFTDAMSGNNDLYDALVDTGGGMAYVSNLSAEQSGDLARMQTAYDKAAATIRDYELGVKGANLTDEARNKKIADQQAIMSTLSDNMQPLLSAGGRYVEITEDGNARTQALNQLLYEQADAAGADAATLAILASATGDYTKAEINAALQTAAMTAKAQELAQQLADGTITVHEARAALEEFSNEWTATARVNVEDNKFRSLLRDLAKFDGGTSRHTAKVNTSGSVPSTGGGTDGKGGAKGATGLDMIVPPGYPNDSFPVWTSSGEHVQVTPTNKGNGAGGNMTVNIDKIIIPSGTSQQGAINIVTAGVSQAMGGLY